MNVDDCQSVKSISDVGVVPTHCYAVGRRCSGVDGNLVWGGRRAIALLGVEGLAVIDTADVLLVTKLDRSPDVRAIVARLNRRGRTDLT